MYEHAFDFVLLRHFQQGVKMGLIRMHATIGNQSEQMKLAATRARVLHGIEQHRMLEEFAILDHELDARRIHMHDSSRADVQVPDFAVAHLAVRQADVRATGLNQRVGILAQQAVVSGLAGKRDCVGFGFGAISPAVEDDEDERFESSHKCSF